MLNGAPGNDCRLLSMGMTNEPAGMSSKLGVAPGKSGSPAAYAEATLQARSGKRKNRARRLSLRVWSFRGAAGKPLLVWFISFELLALDNLCRVPGRSRIHGDCHF